MSKRQATTPSVISLEPAGGAKAPLTSRAAPYSGAHWRKPVAAMTWDDVRRRSRDLSEGADRLLERLAVKR